MNLPPKMLTSATVAEMLGISTRTVCLWAECRELPCLKVGRQWRFPESRIRQWIRDRVEFQDGVAKHDRPGPHRSPAA